jgi:hypothetical protein
MLNCNPYEKDGAIVGAVRLWHEVGRKVLLASSPFSSCYESHIRIIVLGFSVDSAPKLPQRSMQLYDWICKGNNSMLGRDNNV